MLSITGVQLREGKAFLGNQTKFVSSTGKEHRMVTARVPQPAEGLITMQQGYASAGVCGCQQIALLHAFARGWMPGFVQDAACCGGHWEYRFARTASQR